jgi:hypothetical protein
MAESDSTTVQPLPNIVGRVDDAPLLDVIAWALHPDIDHGTIGSQVMQRLARELSSAANKTLAEPPGWMQIQAGSELSRLIDLVRFVPGEEPRFFHSRYDASQILWRWFLKWRTQPKVDARPRAQTCADHGCQVIPEHQHAARLAENASE